MPVLTVLLTFCGFFSSLAAPKPYSGLGPLGILTVYNLLIFHVDTSEKPP